MIADCRRPFWSLAMVVCPVALAVGCGKCPIYKMCPLKGVIGDYKTPADIIAAKPAVAAAARPVRKAQAKKKKKR
jgi:hypothetical protein